nr:hypothetical protein [Egicoccus halophilus]
MNAADLDLGCGRRPRPVPRVGPAFRGPATEPRPGEVEGDRAQPGVRTGHARHAAPALEGPGEGVLRQLLGDRGIAAVQREAADKWAVLAVHEGPEGLVVGRHHCHLAVLVSGI